MRFLLISLFAILQLLAANGAGALTMRRHKLDSQRAQLRGRSDGAQEVSAPQLFIINMVRRAGRATKGLPTDRQH